MLGKKTAIYILVIVLLGGAFGIGGASLWYQTPNRDDSLASIKITDVLVHKKQSKTFQRNEPVVPTNKNSGTHEETPDKAPEVEFTEKQPDQRRKFLIPSNEKSELVAETNLSAREEFIPETIFEPRPVKEHTHLYAKSTNNNAFGSRHTDLRYPTSDAKNWQINAVKIVNMPPGSHVAIVIDDAGVDQKRTRQALALTGPLTFSFLPYARSLDRQINNAKSAGHEVLAHIPMEPLNSALDTGPNALNTDLTDQEIKYRLDWALSQTPGVVGINNHMGSLFTSDVRGMKLVMGELRRRGLLFLDSRTTPNTLGAKLAHLNQVPFAVRNIFLDHHDNLDFIYGQLEELEAFAKRQGYAVAIGHPRDATIEALAQWLPVIAEKGLVLVPITTIAAKRIEMRQNTVKLSTN